MGRQRIVRQEGSAPATMEQELLDPAADAFVREAARTPGQLMSGLSRADSQTRAFAVQRLQAGVGNAAVGAMLAGRQVRATHLRAESRAGDTATHATIQRDGGDIPDAGAQALDSPIAEAAVTETIGPPVDKNGMSIGLPSLADANNLLGLDGDVELGSVRVIPEISMSAEGGAGIRVGRAHVAIELAMPEWPLPSTILPKARGEWARYRASLLAHEQGHVKLVHDVYRGLAKRLQGKPFEVGQEMIEAARTSLLAKNGEYDRATNYGKTSGVILNVGIERQELEEDQKKQEAAKAQGRDSAGAGASGAD